MAQECELLSKCGFSKNTRKQKIWPAEDLLTSIAKDPTLINVKGRNIEGHMEKLLLMT